MEASITTRLLSSILATRRERSRQLRGCGLDGGVFDRIGSFQRYSCRILLVGARPLRLQQPAWTNPIGCVLPVSMLFNGAGIAVFIKSINKVIPNKFKFKWKRKFKSQSNSRIGLVRAVELAP